MTAAVCLFFSSRDHNFYSVLVYVSLQLQTLWIHVTAISAMVVATVLLEMASQHANVQAVATNVCQSVAKQTTDTVHTGVRVI